MLITTIESIPGRNIIEVKGIVRGSTVRARNIGRDITAGFRNIVGGELPEYTNLLDESRALAIERMTQEAESMGANAIVGARFTTSGITQGASEILAFGTAVVVED
ncbi:MAG: YbjQ family protein [Dehalococcoidia bacterium]|nr:YbjQ family protein [Dehalococcoidia bacterium]